MPPVRVAITVSSHEKFVNPRKEKEQDMPAVKKPSTANVWIKDKSKPQAQSALETQVGGDHYTKMAIQPMEYSMANGLDACQHTIIKYVTRFRDKNGVQDLLKARHVIDMLIEFEEKRNESKA